MTREEMDFIGGMNMCDEISNEAYKKIMCHCEESEPCEDAETITVSKGTLKLRTGRFVVYDVEWLKEHFNTTEAMLYGKHFDKDINVPTTDAVSKEQAIDAIEKLKVIISNNLPEMVYRSSVLKILEELPSVQPEQKEITMEDVKAYCEPRNLVVLTKELFDQMNNTADKIYLYLKDRERR